MGEFIFFSVGQGEVLTKEIPKDDEEIRITNGWSKGMVHDKFSSQDKVGRVPPCVFTIVVGSILGHVELRANDIGKTHPSLAKTVRTMQVKNQRGSIGFVPTPLLQELQTE